MHLFETIERVHRIHKLIQREATGTPEEFAEKLSIRKRQLYNVLEEFKDYGAVVKYSRVKRTFYYENDFKVSVEVSVVPLSSDEKRIIISGNYGHDPFRG